MSFPLPAAQSGARLVAAMGKQPKPPCLDAGDGKPCPFFYRCRFNLLACESFAGYVIEPQHGKKYAHWPIMPREPSRAWYVQTFENVRENTADISATTEEPEPLPDSYYQHEMSTP